MVLQPSDSNNITSEKNVVSFSKDNISDLLLFIKSPAVIFSKSYKISAHNKLFQDLINEHNLSSLDFINTLPTKISTKFNDAVQKFEKSKSGKTKITVQLDDTTDYETVIQNLGDSNSYYLAIFEKKSANDQSKDDQKIVKYETQEVQLEELQLLDLFSLEQLQRLQDSFCDAVGVASVICDVNGIPITKPSNITRLCYDLIRNTDVGLKNCIYSDACLGKPKNDGASVSPCYSAGLYDGGASIMVGDKHIANWLIGQVRGKDQNIDELVKYASVIGVDEEEYKKALLEVPVINKDRFENIANLLFILANQLSNLAYDNVQQGHIMKINDKIHKAMVESEERFRILVENAPEAIVVFDLDTVKIVDTNQKATNLFGLSRSELVNRNLTSLSPEVLPTGDNAVDKFREYLNKTKESSNCTFKWWCINNKKELIPCEVSLTRLPYSYKRIIRGSIVDITEREKADNAIKKLNAELEHKIDDRTKELIQINKELDDFAYIVSHDLKAPLRGINQLAYWIKTDNEDKLDEDGKTNLNLLMERVEKMNSLIEGVLEYSRVGKVSSELQCLDLNEIVAYVIELLGLDENVTINKKDNLPFVFGEKLKIEQVFQNIISNAVRYCDKDICKIDIYSFENEDYYQINIKDNGPGIEEKYHEKIFEVFQSISSKKESTGIGLSIVKKVMHSYNGRVSVTSPIKPSDYGTIFTLSFPKNINVNFY